MLHWAGKQLPAAVPAPAPRLVDLVGKPHGQAAHRPSAIYHGDNQESLAHLLESGLRGRVRLVYIDPPFDSGSDYLRKVRLRDGKGRRLVDQFQYRDIWQGDSYLQFIYARLLLLRDLLADDGSIWLHCDYRRIHRLHLLLEEVFGAENYLNTITWRSQVARGAKVNAFYFPFSTHFISVFAKNRSAPTVWNPQKKHLVFTRKQAAAQFMEDEQGFFRTSDPGTYSFASLVELHRQGRLYAPYGGEIVVDQEAQRVYASNGGNIGVKYYLTPLGRGRYGVERAVDNLWDDIPGLGTTPGEDTGYPTQKTEALLERIIGASSNPGDWVLDCFAGSGTTAAVAARMARRWLACDLNYGAVQTVRRRLWPAAQAGPGFAVYRLPGVADDRLPGLGPDRRLVVKMVRRDGEVELVLRDYHPGAAAAHLPAEARADWRALLDGVEIDPAYDGAVFRSLVADLPAKRGAPVQGLYRLGPLPPESRVAVRVTDILGQEILVARKV